MPWVVAAVVATLGLAALAGPIAANTGGGGSAPGRGGCAVGAGWGAPNTSAAGAVLRLVNAHRARIGARPLKAAPSLTRAAVWKSSHMMRFRYFAHDDGPAARTTAQRLSACGYRRPSWAENLAFGHRTPAAVVRAWLDSPGHRANIENRRFTTTGIGVVAKNGRATQWTETFGVGA
jgi:uncharacterized protein YkwD